jgi:hypothetical protein
MQVYYDLEALSSDVKQAIEAALSKHAIDTSFAAIAVCAVIEAIGSPLKKQISGTPLCAPVGMAGVDIYACAKLLSAVERIRNPNSVIVSPLMDCIVAALSGSRAALSDTELLKRIVMIRLARKTLSISEFEETLATDKSIEPAFVSAKQYLLTGGVIEKHRDGRRWQLAGNLRDAADSFRRLKRVYSL